jgi:uncharacterized membrane protein YbhN (UPF0104 family)
MTRTRLVRIAILALVGLTLAWFRRDLTAAFTLLRGRLTVGLAAGILAVTLVHFANEPLRWWLLLRKRYPHLALVQVYHTLTATALASYAIPMRLGMPVRVLLAKRQLGVPYTATGALLIVDGLFNYGAWSLAAALGGMRLLPGSHVQGLALLLVLIIGGAAALLFVAGRRWLPESGTDFGARFATGLRSLSPTVGLLNATLLVLDVLSYGVRHALILAAFGIEASFWAVTAAVAISILAGFASLMPLGLGAYDVSLAFLLAGIGVPREVAVAVPLINRLAGISTGLLLGSVSAHHLGIRPSLDLVAADAAPSSRA